MKDLEQYILDLQDAITYESSKDSELGNSVKWTPEYKAGYVDGLKRAVELLEENS